MLEAGCGADPVQPDTDEGLTDTDALDEVDVAEGDLQSEHQELAHTPPRQKKRDLGLEQPPLTSKGVATKLRVAVLPPTTCRLL